MSPHSPVPPDRSRAPGDRSAHWRLAAALAALTLLAYSPVVRNGFVDYDDALYAGEQPHVQSGLTADSIRYAWTTLDYGNWHPLTWMSLQLDVSLFGFHPLPFHLTNVLLHIATVVLICLWLADATGESGASAAVAGLFAVHPLHVESVAWLAERKDVLSGFWLACALLAYTRYVRRPGAGNYLLVTAAFGLGLLSKSMLVTLPVLLWLVDYWPLGRMKSVGQTFLSAGNVGRAGQPARNTLPPAPSLKREGGKRPPPSFFFRFPLAAFLSSAARQEPRPPGAGVFIEKLPWLAMSLGVGVVTIFAQSSAGTVARTDSLGWTYRLANALNGYGFYLTKTFWPVDLIVFYPHPLETVSLTSATIWGIVLLAVTAVALWNFNRRPWLILGWGWFVISLLPVIGLLQVGQQAYADRYSYIPQLGLLIAVVWEARRWLAALRMSPSTGNVMTGTAMIALAALTARQVAVWKHTGTLWSHALAVHEDNWLAHERLGEYLLDQNEFDRAIPHFVRRAELRPTDGNGQALLGRVAVLQQDWLRAEQHLQSALAIAPNHPNATFNMFVTARELGQPDVAADALSRYCEVFPNDVQARCELARLRAELGDIAGALREAQRAVEIAPGFADAHYLAGRLLIEKQDWPLAKAHLLAAVKSNSRLAAAHALLGDLFVRERNGEAAALHYQQALALAPTDEATRRKLNVLMGN